MDVISTEDLVDWLRSDKPMIFLIIGGCCGISPDHIAALRQQLEDSLNNRKNLAWR